MKSILLALLVLFGSLSASGQGTVLFGNRIPGVVDAPVHSPAHGSVGPLDTRFLAQLQYFTGGNWVSVGEPIPLASGTEGVPGYFGPVVLPIPGVFPGQQALVRTAVWYGGLGANFAQAMETYWSGVGLSGEFYVGPLGDGDQTPAPLTALNSFSIGTTLGLDIRPQIPVPASLTRDPHFTGVSLHTWPLIEFVRDLVVSGDRAYLAAGCGGLQVIDLQNPSGPQLAGYAFTPYGQARVVAVQDTLAAVIVDHPSSHPTGDELMIFSLAQPDQPQLLGGVPLPGTPARVVLSGNLALVTVGPAGLAIVDLQERSSPSLLTTFPTGGNAVGLAALPNLAWVAAGSEGLQILDLTQPAQPVRIGQWHGTEAAVEVAYRAPFAAVATVGTSGTFLEMVDLSNPSQPQSGSVLPLSTGHPTLLWDHDHLYIAHKYQGIGVIDVLDPTHPRQVGGTTTYYGGGALGMARHQDRLWVADFIAISAFQVGPRLRFQPNQTLELLATPGLPYLIQQQASWANPTWTPWLEITPTNTIQSLTVPPTPEPAGTYFLRAIPAP